MLTITIPATEVFNNQTEEFITFKEQRITLEHSLVSLAKWESKWHKPFLSNDNKNPKTSAETIDYIRCMTISQNVDPNVYSFLTKDNMDEVNAYISDPMTATWFNDDQAQNKRPVRKQQVITAELIYYWMISFNIPFECQKWHLNRLLTLIRVCSIKSQEGNKKNKMSKRDILSRNAALNQARRKQYNTTG